MRISDCSSDVCSSDLVVAAALDGADEAEADVSSSELENETTRLAREQLSALVAAEAGDPPPEPGSHAETLSEAFPTGDPIERIDLVATRLAEQRTADDRSEEHTSELQSLMRISYAVFGLKK